MIARKKIQIWENLLLRILALSGSLVSSSATDPVHYLSKNDRKFQHSPSLDTCCVTILKHERPQLNMKVNHIAILQGPEWGMGVVGGKREGHSHFFGLIDANVFFLPPFLSLFLPFFFLCFFLSFFLSSFLSSFLPFSFLPFSFLFFFVNVLFVCSLCLTHFIKCLQNPVPVLGPGPIITSEQTEQCLEYDSHLEAHFLSEILSR